MRLQNILDDLEKIAPLSAAEPWDNVGLLVGDPNQQIHQIFLTIDYTQPVAEEAHGKGDRTLLIVAYHPPIFAPLKRLQSGSLIFDAIQRGIAIYSPHTALDAAPGGTNDMLADVLGLTDPTPLRIESAPSTNLKLITFVPPEKLDQLSQALFDAGAGRIGNYTSCSFRCEGTGTFFGTENTNPAVGQRGKLEQVTEIRLEAIVPISAVAPVVAALRKNHPYEEPAFDLVQLAADPTNGGQGRIGSLQNIDRKTLIDRIKQELSLTHVLVSGPTTGLVTRAAACPGSCGDLLDAAIAAGAQLYLTGEIRHHDALKAAAANMTVVCTLHSNSERAALKRLKAKLEKTPNIPPITISTTDRDPFVVL
jgi:dinuclear metal center YbgI/SA1388 family protein